MAGGVLWVRVKNAPRIDPRGCGLQVEEFFDDGQDDHPDKGDK
jgi:hypothetical protein